MKTTDQAFLRLYSKRSTASTRAENAVTDRPLFHITSEPTQNSAAVKQRNALPVPVSQDNSVHQADTPFIAGPHFHTVQVVSPQTEYIGWSPMSQQAYHPVQCEHAFSEASIALAHQKTMNAGATEKVAANLDNATEFRHHRHDISGFELAERQLPPRPHMFQPVWEVDAFGWPQTVVALNSLAHEAWLYAGKAMRRACQDGLGVLAITSPIRGAGRTTVSIEIARQVAHTGLNVALLEADFEHPMLAERLCVEVVRGWLDTIACDLPIDESAIYSIADRLTLVPLARPLPQISNGRLSVQLNEAIAQLRRSFDLIVIDGGEIGGSGSIICGQTAQEIDAVWLVTDVRQENRELRSAAIARLQQAGIGHLGVIENFAVDTAVST